MALALPLGYTPKYRSGSCRLAPPFSAMPANGGPPPDATLRLERRKRQKLKDIAQGPVGYHFKVIKNL